MNKRILYINANNNEIGGADIALLHLVIEAKNQGYTPVVLLRAHTAIVQRYIEYGVKVIIKPIVRLRASSHWLTKFSYLYQIPKTFLLIVRVIKSERIALVHSNDFIDGIANVAAWIVGVPVVQHVRMIRNNPDWLINFLKFLSVSFTDYVICVSVQVKLIMYQKISSKILVIYDWVDENLQSIQGVPHSLHHELELSDEILLIGCVGRLEWWKGQHVFLEAAELVASKVQNVHFLLIGGATTQKEDYVEYLKARSKKSVYASKISFLGHRTDISNILSQLFVLVHTSVLPEPFGLVIMEGMYEGTLVIAANAGGVLDQVIDGETGYLYIPGDAIKLAEKIIHAITAPDRQRITENAKVLVKTKFSKHENFSSIRNLYNQLLGIKIKYSKES